MELDDYWSLGKIFRIRVKVVNYDEEKFSWLIQTLQEIHIEQIEHEHGDHGEALDGKYDENLCHFVFSDTALELLEQLAELNSHLFNSKHRSPDGLLLQHKCDRHHYLKQQ